ncbi:hypothetical protein ABID16_002304 [Rhizobium aquaticum]|uniref:Transmembrane protein n=1 Tax=Rhizobium aquaticum TaxID=1549636 RepID=A0ABV2IZS0_9HYPH
MQNNVKFGRRGAPKRAPEPAHAPPPKADSKTDVDLKSLYANFQADVARENAQAQGDGGSLLRTEKTPGGKLGKAFHDWTMRSKTNMAIGLTLVFSLTSFPFLLQFYFYNKHKALYIICRRCSFFTTEHLIYYDKSPTYFKFLLIVYVSVGVSLHAYLIFILLYRAARNRSS